MKKIIFAASLVLLMLISAPLLAEETHHPKEETVTTTVYEGADEIDTSLDQMQVMREKVSAEKDPLKRRALMHEHMKKMRKGMDMMSSMTSKHKMMDQDTSSMPMAQRMSMMENKVKMMEKMMEKKGGMMMGGMMNKSADKSAEDRLMTMEKRMMMMQEIMEGMLMMHELNMKK